MDDKIVKTEVLYTYEAWLNRYERERHHEWLCRQKEFKEIREEQRKRRNYFCKQKMAGILITIISVFLMILFLLGCTGFAEIVATLLFWGLPAGFGLLLILTDEMVIMDKYWEECQERKND